MQQKLKINEYILEIKQNNIHNAYLEYSFDKIQCSNFKDGKKINTNLIDSINFQISGIDENNKEAYLSFLIKTNLKELNKYTNKPIDITNYLVEGELIVKEPPEDLFDFLDFYRSKNTIDDMYNHISNLYVFKICENNFIFKLSIPNEVFLCFKVEF